MKYWFVVSDFKAASEALATPAPPCPHQQDSVAQREAICSLRALLASLIRLYRTIVPDADIAIWEKAASLEPPEPCPHQQEAERLQMALGVEGIHRRQLGADVRALLTQIDAFQEAIGQHLDEEDSAVVEEIRQRIEASGLEASHEK